MPSTKPLSNTDYIKESLAIRAPFLAVMQVKSGYMLGIPGHPFLLQECQKPIGRTLSDKTPQQLDEIISRALPTPELISRYYKNLTPHRDTVRQDLQHAIETCNWANVSTLAAEMVTIEQQLAVLALAEDYTLPAHLHPDATSHA